MEVCVASLFLGCSRWLWFRARNPRNPTFKQKLPRSNLLRRQRRHWISKGSAGQTLNRTPFQPEPPIVQRRYPSGFPRHHFSFRQRPHSNRRLTHFKLRRRRFYHHRHHYHHLLLRHFRELHRREVGLARQTPRENLVRWGVVCWMASASFREARLLTTGLRLGLCLGHAVGMVGRVRVVAACRQELRYRRQQAKCRLKSYGRGMSFGVRIGEVCKRCVCSRRSGCGFRIIPWRTFDFEMGLS